jgi:hypothetical protein
VEVHGLYSPGLDLMASFLLLVAMEPFAPPSHFYFGCCTPNGVAAHPKALG